jgi:uncharacterized membrane protein HdeD (DUF308 family)
VRPDGIFSSKQQGPAATLQETQDRHAINAYQSKRVGAGRDNKAGSVITLCLRSYSLFQEAVMTTVNVDEFRHDFRSALRRHWVLFLIPGVVMVILGLLAAAAPFVATLVVETFAGWLFLTGGFVGLAALFTTRNVPGFMWTLVAALLAILIGAFLVWRPFAGVVTLTLALAAYFAAHGVVQILTSLDHRKLFARSWLWMAISGIADLILAGLIIAGWPGSVAWALGLLVGVNLFMSGLALVMTAIACRTIAPEQAAPIRRTT